MKINVPYDLDIAIPHKPPMRLVDTILDIQANEASTEVLITASHLFYNKAISGVYAWVGAEMMAQTAAVFVYGKSFEEFQDAQASLAFLTSIRSYQSLLPYFPLGSCLRIRVENILLEGEVGAFEGEIYYNDKCIATAKLTAYRPSHEKQQALLES